MNKVKKSWIITITIILILALSNPTESDTIKNIHTDFTIFKILSKKYILCIYLLVA